MGVWRVAVSRGPCTSHIHATLLVVGGGGWRGAGGGGGGVLPLVALSALSCPLLTLPAAAIASHRIGFGLQAPPTPSHSFPPLPTPSFPHSCPTAAATATACCLAVPGQVPGPVPGPGPGACHPARASAEPGLEACATRGQHRISIGSASDQQRINIGSAWPPVAHIARRMCHARGWCPVE